MGKIDPQQLLSLFRADLTENGGIRNEKEVLTKLSGLIPNYSKKLVTRCVYLNVLKQTEESALDEYLENKGWETLNTWLKSAKEDGNQPFLELELELLLRCPVTVDRLKKTDTAKLVKGLRKKGEGNTEKISELADLLYNKWLQVIGAANAAAATATANGTAVAGSNGTVAETKVKKKRKGSVDGNDSSSNSSDAIAGGATMDTNSGQGLAATQINKHKSGRHDPVSSNGTTAATVTATTATTTAPILTPSDLFMTAVTQAAAVIETPKRKKKTSNDNSADHSISKKSKTMSTGIEVIASVDAIDDTLSRIIEQDMSTRNNNLTSSSPEFNRSLSDLPITPTSSTPLTSTPLRTAPFTPTLTSTPSANDATLGPDKSYPRGCLHYGSSSSKKKAVRWLPDESMTRIKYFDSQQDERVNVWRQQMQEQNESKLAEGQAFKDRSMMMGDGSNSTSSSSDARIWVPLQTIDIPNGVMVRGQASEEKKIEAERQSHTLADLFVSKDMIPDSAAEPDPLLQSIPIGQTVIIPTDGGQVEDFSMKPLPPARNNPLFGESFLQPHQMELDRSLLSASRGVTGAAAVGPASSVMFASSYNQQQGPVNPAAVNGVNRGQPNYRNLNMRDLRNAKGQQVCSYYFRHGNCHRDPCRFIHTRDVVENWNANSGPAPAVPGPGFRGGHRNRSARSSPQNQHHASQANEQMASSVFAPDWNPAASANAATSLPPAASIIS